MSGAEVALLAAGTAASAVGAIQSANAQAEFAEAQAQAADFNRKVAERNQIIAGQQRQLAIQGAQIDAEDKRRENRRKLASIRNSFGASGIELAGSPLSIVEDSATELELDARRTEYDGQVAGYRSALQIMGLQDEANLAGVSAQSARSRARSARTAGFLNAGGAIAGGGAQTAGTDYARQNWWT